MSLGTDDSNLVKVFQSGEGASDSEGIVQRPCHKQMLKKP